MDSKFKISVITPSLNSEKHIESAIQSVLDQDYLNYEHLIVDGQSTDNTIGILKKYPHLHWVSEPDNGQSHAMNKGFRMSRGEIIVYLNADDYFLPGAFKAVIPYFEEGSKFVVGNVKVIMEDGMDWLNIPNVRHEKILRHWEPNAYPVNPVGYFYSREVLENVGGFNEESHFTMDLEFLLAASQKYNFTKINELLGVYRYLPGTKTAETQSKENYWSKERFPFIDDYLVFFSEEHVEEFHREREIGYKRRNEQLLAGRNWRKKKLRVFLRRIKGLFIEKRESSVCDRDGKN